MPAGPLSSAVMTDEFHQGRIQKKNSEGFWERDAEGAEDESPQATRPRRQTRRGGREWGGGLPPQPTRGSGVAAKCDSNAA